MSGLFQELKRRNVFRVAIAYLAVAWLILQVADIVFENIGAPAWVMQAVMFTIAIGFPLAVLFAWAFEMTPEGIKKEKDVDRTQSITSQTGAETQSHHHRGPARGRWLPAGGQIHAERWRIA
jgi:hypothetical protein